MLEVVRPATLYFLSMVPLDRQTRRRTLKLAAPPPTTLAGKVAFRATAPLRRAWFPGSLNFWDNAYASGLTSGPGSAGEPARYKAAFVNDFITSHGLESVIELGCGDGSQLELGNYHSYIGLDVSPTAVQMCAKKFAHDPSKSFFLYEPRSFVDKAGVFRADIVLSLDVVFHLVEDEVCELYLEHLFAAARSFVIVYSSDVDDPGTSPPYTKHRHYTRWVTEHLPDWTIIAQEPNPHGGSALTSSEFRVFQRLGTAP
jgi:hypothetical protein